MKANLRNDCAKIKLVLYFGNFVISFFHYLGKLLREYEEEKP